MRKMTAKPQKSKRNRLILSSVFFCTVSCLISCQVGDQLRMRIEMPRKSPINLEKYDEIIVTNFIVKEKAENFDINKELGDYFTTELEHNLDKKISSRKIDIEDTEMFESQDFWKGLLPDQKQAILFTGNVEYTQEIRKSIKSAEKRRFESPFPEESRIEERRFYSLSLQLFLIDSNSGETLYKRTFKENKAYQNPNQTAYFAFYDLMMTIKEKLFRQIRGEEQSQERYLIK